MYKADDSKDFGGKGNRKGNKKYFGKVLKKSCKADIIKERFKDKKYISHRMINGYYYSIYVREPKADFADAITFLNIIVENGDSVRSWYEGRNIDERRMRRAAYQLRTYAEKRMGVFKLFFTKARNSYMFSQTFYRPVAYHENICFKDVCDKINSYNSYDLFSQLIGAIHSYNEPNEAYIELALSSRDFFCMFLDGASFEPDIKTDLLKMFDMCDLSDKSNPSLPSLLCAFITDFYNEYLKIYSTVTDLMKAFHKRTVAEILLNGDLPKVTDNIVFRKYLFMGSKEKSVCIKLCLFSAATDTMYSALNDMSIHYGPAERVNIYPFDNYRNIGNKLKPFANSNIRTVLHLLSFMPLNINQIAEILEISVNGAYKLMQKLRKYNCVIKAPETHTFCINKQHIIKLCILLEIIGGLRNNG